ncbi:hypothetical protein DFH07DRAFT_766554 [Mycena maculata]|uniref:Uncharacterized protein n=1 Tax=Mycena maculata TaxID=230809 RepID=A0AAD7K2G7_9AGAR|nr:hypothetical protein DFH07DRAFT_766554 [Mycena maculata]
MSEAQCARDSGGNLKDASEIEFYNSESDDKSIPGAPSDKLTKSLTVEHADEDGNPQMKCVPARWGGEAQEEPQANIIKSLELGKEIAGTRVIFPGNLNFNIPRHMAIKTRISNENGGRYGCRHLPDVPALIFIFKEREHSSENMARVHIPSDDHLAFKFAGIVFDAAAARIRCIPHTAHLPF